MSVSYVQVRDDLLKLLAGEIIREVIGSSNYKLKIGKVENLLIEKIGLDSLKRFKKSLAKTSRRGSDAKGAWNTFVKTIEGVKHERTGSQRSLKLKITSVERKKAIEISKTTKILKDLSVFDYRMAILCEAFKTALDSEDSSINHKGLGGNNVLHFSSALPTDASDRQKFNLMLIEFLVNKNLDPRMTNDKSMTALHIIIGNYILDPRKAAFDPVAVQSSFDCTTSINQRYKLLCCFSLNRPFDVRGPHGNSILHEWAIRGSICGYGKNDQLIEEEARIGQWIITSADVSPNKTNDYGCTSLHYAFRDHLAEVLCEKRADKERRNDFGETPLMYRLKHCFLRGFVHEVLPKGWDLEITLINRLGIKRNDADMNLKRIVEFHTISLEVLAETLGNLELLKFDLKERDKLNQDKDCLDYLLCILRDCLCEDCKEETGKHFKTLKCLLECVTRQIDKYAVLCGEKTGSKAPLYQMLLVYFDALDLLHDEIKTKIVECVEKMLEAGADPNIRDSNGNTVLHLCCQKVDPSKEQQKELVKLICEYGADPKKKNNAKVSATQILEKRGGKCTELARDIESLKPKLRVKVDLKSKLYKKALDNLCRRENPERVGALRYDPEYIGKGAMSHIYLAIDEESKREVALKRILKANYQKELQSEIKSLVKLEQNSNIVGYYFLEEDSNFHYIAIELMEGDLSYLVKEYVTLGLSLDEETTIKLATDVVEGLTFLHQANILHRDLKPGNILFRLNPELCLKLADFGLSKHLTPSVNQSTVLGSTSSSLTGTRGWMAPELVRREVQSHCQKTDMFALGLVLHFLISKGFHPFDQSKTPLYIVISNGALKPHELETSICSGNPEHLWKNLTPEAKHLMVLLLSNDPSLRPLSKDLLKCSCYFWSKLKKVKFMETVGNQIEIAKPSSQDHYLVVSKFEYSTFGDQVRINPWNMKFSVLSNELYAKRAYDDKTVIDLIRFFRNAYAHYEERSLTCKIQLLNDIFFATFPDFFLTVFTMVNELGWLKSNSGRNWLLRVLNEMR